MKHLAILILVAGSLIAYSQAQQLEQVCLSMVLIRAPQTDTPAQINEARYKAEQVWNSVQRGISSLKGQRRRKEGQSAVLSGEHSPSNLKIESLRCR